MSDMPTTDSVWTPKPLSETHHTTPTGGQDFFIMYGLVHNNKVYVVRFASAATNVVNIVGVAALP